MAENYIAQHEVNNDDTLSGLALHYYGSAAKELWMLIYEANKDVIGPNPNILRPGIVIKIPPKTDLSASQDQSSRSLHANLPSQPSQTAQPDQPEQHTTGSLKVREGGKEEKMD